MASSLIIHGKQMGKEWNHSRLQILDCKITADGDGNPDLKRCLLLMTNLDSIVKGKDITFPTKVHLVSATVFPIVMYGCEIWTIEKAECRRIDAFEL